MGKIDRLNKQMEALERKIEMEEIKIEDARERCEQKQITKAQFTQIKMHCSERARAFRGAITRKEKARMMFERKRKEKEEKRREKVEKRDEKYEKKLKAREAKRKTKEEDD